MARVKMNNEYRTKIKNLTRRSLDNDSANPKREAYLQHLEYTKENYPIFFSKAKAIVQGLILKSIVILYSISKIFMVALVILLLKIVATTLLIQIMI